MSKLSLRTILFLSVAATMLVAPATSHAITAGLFMVDGVATLSVQDDPKSDAQIYVSDSYVRGADDNSEQLTVTVAEKDDAPKQITLDPASLPGCTAGNETTSPEDVYVQCQFDLVKRVLVVTGDEDDSVNVSTSSNEEDRKLPPVYADLGAGDDYFNNEAYGNEPPSTVLGGPGKDSLYGGASKDQLDGGPGDDYVEGNGGPDLVAGGAGNDTVSGDSAGCISVCGDMHKDVVLGGPGKDVLSAGRGADVINGGPGNDTIEDQADGKVDSIVGGPGSDDLRNVDYNHRTYRFKDRVGTVEKVRDGMFGSTTWTCTPAKCTVRKTVWLPGTVVVIVL